MVKDIIPGIVLPDNYDSMCNCSYASATTGEQAKVSIAALIKLMKSIPETPRIFIMDIELTRNNLLPKNTIYISSDIAEALDEVLKGGTDGS